MILDNLRKAGIQNGRRNERLTFTSVEPYPGTHVHAIGEVLGVDVYDPTTGIVRSQQTEQIAVKVINDYGDEVMQVFDV